MAAATSSTAAASAAQAGPDVRKMPIAKALNESLRSAMENDPKVLIMGEDVGKLGGVFRITDGLQKDFGEQRLRRLAVVLDGADSARVRDADDDGQLDLAQRAGVHLGELRDDLVVGREDETVELDLHDRPVAAQGETDRGADDAGLRERRVHHPVGAEVLGQAVGHAEHPAEGADVLAHEHDLLVALQGLAHARVDRLGERHPLAHS